MYKAILVALCGLILFSHAAMAQCSSYPYTLTNGTTADATQVMANFNCAALTSGATIASATLTSATLTGATVTGATVSGTTTLPGSGTITSGGNLGLGISSPTQMLDIYGGNELIQGLTPGVPGSNSILYMGTTDQYIQATWGTGVEIGVYAVANALSIAQTSGTVTIVGCMNYNGGTLGTCISDERVKKGVAPYTAVGLAEIDKLQPVTYQYNGLGGTKADNVTRNGFVAQQVLQVAPSMVTTTHAKLNPNDTMDTKLYEVDYAKLEFGLVNAIKDMEGAVNTLAYKGHNAAAITVDASGNVGVNSSSPSYPLDINGSVAGAGAYYNLSDARLKKNIVPINNALSLLEGVQGVRFEWRSVDERRVGKSLKLSLDQPQVGFIAQDLERVVPEAVSTAGGPDQIKSVAESKLVPILVEAVKELKAANDNQTAQIRSLKIQVGALERRVGVQTAAK